MKKLFIGILVVLVIIVGVAFYGASQSGTIIRTAVLEYAPKATGTSVTLDKVNVSMLGGHAGLVGLDVGNPSGFKSEYAVKLGNVDVQIDLESLLNDVIRIKQVRIEGADLIYEIGSKGNNISTIQKNIEAYTASLGLGASKSDSAAKFIVDDILITGTKVKLATDLLGGKGAGLTLPDIHLKNIGSEGKGATAGEVGTAIFGALNQGLSNVITKDMLKGAMGTVKKKLGGELKKQLGDLF